MYDVIIIGAGPAGMTSAIYTARKGLQTLLIAKEAGGQMIWTNDIENYTGFSMISGTDLTAKFQEHVEKLKDKIDIKIGKEVVGLEKNFTSFLVTDQAGEMYYGKTVIVATGKISRRLAVPGESKFYGKGVSTCATCDGPLYKNKTVAVIGGGNSAMEAILSLSKMVKNILSINIGERFSGDKVLAKKVSALLNVRFIQSAKTLSIDGGEKLSGVTIQQFGKDAEHLPVDGVFVEIGYEVPKPFEQLMNRNPQGEIKVSGNMETSVPGLFAAGDSNDAWGDQIIIAAGEGAKAALAAANYLSRLK